MLRSPPRPRQKVDRLLDQPVRADARQAAQASPNRTFHSRAWRLTAWAAAVMLLGLAAPAPAQKAPKAAAPKARLAAGKAPAALDAQKQFTIVRIEPDAKQEEVRVFFSQPVPLPVIKANLSLLPRVRLDWSRCTVGPDGAATLRGNFKYGIAYLVALPDNLMVGNKTYVSTVTTFFLPHRPPKVEFVENKSVIERDSRQLLHVRAQNVKALLFEGVKVPPLLLPLALAAEKDPGTWDRTLEQFKAGAEQLKALVPSRKSLTPFSGEPLVEKQMFPAAGEKNKLVAVSLPLSFRRDKEAGVLELIRVTDQADSGAGTGPRVFRITDLGLTYKHGSQSLIIWVTSLKSGNPAAGVQVAGFTRDMKVFPLGQTDQDGILVFDRKELEGLDLGRLARMEAVKEVVDHSRLVCLMARAPDDISFIEVQPGGNLKPEGIWQVKAGEKVRRLKGHVFTERGVYRPGEKVYFKGTLREFLDGKIIPPPGEACSIAVVNPMGERVFEFNGEASEFGTVAGEFTAESHWRLGAYTLTMAFGPETAGENQAPKKKRRYRRAPAAEDEEGEPARKEVSCTFQMQEFKPPRHFVDIAFKQFRRTVKDSVNRSEREAEFVRITLSSEYYAGGPVKHGQVRWKVHKSRTGYQVAGYEGFTFGYGGEEQGELIESGQAILDDKGRAEVEFPLNRQILAGEQGLYVAATVVDFDGRAVTNNKVFQADPEILVGISRHPEEVESGEGQVLKVAVVRRDGKPIRTGAVQAEVLQHSWASVPKRNEQGDVYWDDQEVWRRSVVTDLNLEKGEAVFRFDFGWGGRYLLAFTYKDAEGRKFASATPYQVRGESYRYDQRERPYQPLPLAADRGAYEPGQTAKITLRPPRPVSRYLVTVEQAGILQHRVVPARPGPQEVEIPIRAEYAPNVYVSVLGVTPRGEFPVFAGRYDTEAPNFYWGNLNLSVRREVERLEVKISPEVKELKAEPGAAVNLDFAVLTSKGQGVEAEMAVAVVDEAVLALTGFKTPSLEDLARFENPLGVFTGELRALLVHQTPFYLSRSERLTGGGGLSGEMMAKLRKRFEAVAYFNPALRTDARGRAKVSFTLPDNMTTYRIYAVVLDRGSRFASQERPLLAAKDFYLEPGLPSFFTQGDSFTFQVAAFNSTSGSGPVKFSAQGDAGLVLKPQDPPGPLPAKDSIKLNVTGQAVKSGPARARFGGEFQGRADAVELALKINSGHIRETAVVSGSLSGPGEIKIALPAHLAAQGIDPGEVTAVLTLAGSPFLRMTAAIDYLLQYPYGCVEQVSSGVLALAALRGLIEDGQVPGVDLAQADKYLKAGVERLLKMQTDNGGFAYWPGVRDVHLWGTFYAAAALGLARANGLTVPEDAVDKMEDYLKRTMAGERASPALKAAACYLLALNGALDAGTYKAAAKDYAVLGRESKLFLLLAASQANLRPQGELQGALKPLIGAAAEAGRQDPEEEFSPRYRTTALALLAGREILPDDPKTGETALYLLGGLDRQGIWTSTSDTGWALMALGAHFKEASFDTGPEEVVISQPGAAPQRRTLDPKGYRTVGLDGAALLKNPVVRVESSPGHTWLYKLELTSPRPDIAAAGAAQGFKVQRTVKNTDGSDDIKVGDLVKVRVLMEVAGKGQRYVVLDDPLPAGLVAVNPALKTEEAAADGDDDIDSTEYVTAEGLLRFWPNHCEIRDDRVLAFCDLVYGGAYVFEYFARAVCQGQFVWPAAKAAAMYAPTVHGYSPVGKMGVKGR